MKYFLYGLLLLILVSCSPVQPDSRELPTKYTDSATMGAAEDANTKDFNENSFNR